MFVSTQLGQSNGHGVVMLSIYSAVRSLLLQKASDGILVAVRIFSVMLNVLCVLPAAQRHFAASLTLQHRQASSFSHITQSSV